MPTIREKIYFNYGGVWSDTFNVLHISTDNGMYEERFVAERSITEKKVRGNSKALYQGIEEEPLEFDMKIAFEGTYTDADIRNIIQWLFPNYYKPLYFQGAEDKIFQCQPVSSSSIIHTGINQGYITLTMRCDSANVYSPVTITPEYTVTGSRTITIENDGDADVYPEISIIKNGAGHLTIESIDDYGNIFEIRDLTNGEDLYINSEKEIIETDIIGVYRYNNIVGEFPRLMQEGNRFLVTGDCTIQFRYVLKYKF